LDIGGSWVELAGIFEQMDGIEEEILALAEHGQAIELDRFAVIELRSSNGMHRHQRPWPIVHRHLGNGGAAG
jgi:hypothetical protein